MKTGGITNMNITKIIKHIKHSDKQTYVVALAGGSASGKSFLSEQLHDWGIKHGYDTVILHQDDFALGKKWKEREKSLYKWDDPDNYRLNEAYDVLTKFINGEQQPFLAYTLTTHEPNVQKKLKWQHAHESNGRRLVLIEGLFAWQEAFGDIADLRVFLEVNFWHRYLLRLQRNVVDLAVTDFQKVTEQYFTFVLRAHTDLLVPIKSTANLVYKNSIDVSSIPSKNTDSDTEYSHVIYSDSEMSIGIDHKNNVVIINKNGIVFREKIPKELIDAMIQLQHDNSL